VTDVEHRGRSAFAEVAEALGIPTDHIMGTVTAGPRRVLVLYTPSLEGTNPPVYRQMLQRTGWGGVYRPMGEPEVVEGFYERLRGVMEDRGWKLPPESGEGG
jgi:hypothetical protein